MLAIVCAGVVLASLDLFIVNVALPQIGHDFHLRGGDLGDLSWVLNGYAIVYAAFLVLFGRLAERYRREHAFLLGVAVFVAASAACGAATSLPMLVAFRVVQAAGAALLTPTSLGSDPRHLPARAPSGRGPDVDGGRGHRGRRWDRSSAGCWWRRAGAGCSSSTSRSDCSRWSWAGGGCPRVPGHPVPAPDPLGAVLITAGVGDARARPREGRELGLGRRRGPLARSLAGVTALGLFAPHVRPRPQPADRPRAVPPAAVHGRLGGGAAVHRPPSAAMLLSRVLWAQEVWHWSALQTGLAIAPGPDHGPAVRVPARGPLIARFGAGTVIAAGCAIFAAGAAWWALAMGLRPDYVGDMLGGMLLTGIGVGLDAADVHGHRGRGAAGALVRHRLGG